MRNVQENFLENAKELERHGFGNAVYPAYVLRSLMSTHVPRHQPSPLPQSFYYYLTIHGYLQPTCHCTCVYIPYQWVIVCNLSAALIVGAVGLPKLRLCYFTHLDNLHNTVEQGHRPR